MRCHTHLLIGGLLTLGLKMRFKGPIAKPERETFITCATLIGYVIQTMTGDGLSLIILNICITQHRHIIIGTVPPKQRADLLEFYIPSPIGT
jgi:hypothetical protein